MYTYCTACRNTSRSHNKLTFFCFPKNELRRNGWLRVIGREDLIERLMDVGKRKYQRICETHFDQRFIFVLGKHNRKKLSLSAFPTLNLFYGEPVASSSQSLAEVEYTIEESKISRAAQTYLNLDDYKHKDKVTIKDFLSISETVTNKSMKQLLKWQIDNKTNKNQYSEGFILFAVSLYNSSSYTYNFLKNTLNLPPVIELQRFILPLAAGLDQRTVNVLKSKVNNMTPQEKICCVTVDCMAVKQSLFYDISNDRIIGFHEINGLQTLHFAKYAVVIMARGIFDNWKQPVVHWFVAESKSVEITEAINEIIDILIQIGLDVRALVKNIVLDTVTQELILDIANPDELTFKVAERDVFRVFDAPQLIQSLKRHLSTCHFVYDDERVLDDVYMEETVKQLYFALNCKMITANNDQEEDLHITILQKMLDFFERLKMVDKDTDQEVISLIKGFQVTIKSILLMRAHFDSDGLNFRLTNRLTLDGIRSFFRKVKKRENCKKPTCRQVSKMFKRTFVHNILTRLDGADHENDLAALLQKMEECPNLEEPASLIRTPTMFAVGTTDYNFELPNMDVIAYISGYVYARCLDEHAECVKLKLFIQRSKTIMQANEEIRKPTVPFPPDTFTDFMYILEKKFQDFFNKTYYFQHVCNSIFNTVEFRTQFCIPCPCFPFYYAAKLFIRFRIYHTIKINNRMLKNDDSDEKTFTAGNLIII